MEGVGLTPVGDLHGLLDVSDVVVDCTASRVAAGNIELYRARGLPFIVQGGEKHSLTGHSFCAETNYASALGRDSTRVVSCNTTSVVRTLSALKRAGILIGPGPHFFGGPRIPGRVTWAGIPSHQGPDARTVDTDLDVVTMAVKVPETLSHLHYWAIQLTRNATRDDLLEAFRTSSRIALIQGRDGLAAINSVKELMADLGRPHDNLSEVALWEDMLTMQGDEAFYAYMVDNQAIVIPETIDAIRALVATVREGAVSIRRTNEALGIGQFTDFPTARPSGSSSVDHQPKA